jgi:hypothetical protein
VNIRFVVRGLLLAVPLAVLISAGWIFFQTPLGRPLDPTPPAPTIIAPVGEMPAGPVGLQEWAQYWGEDYAPVGSGFLFSLAEGGIVGATAAHSVRVGSPDHPLQRIALGVAGRAGFVAEFDTLRGQPGRSLTPDNLAVDYLLLEGNVPIEPGSVLVPDPRGAPQPGERVALYSGLGDGRGGSSILEGTVQSVDDNAIWVLMDDRFNPGQMSGSPFVSQHTGQVVGMAVAASVRRTRLLIGAHPIGSLVGLAESATEFPKMVELAQERE